MTPLAERLARRIEASGPIGLAEFMAAALADREHGYYRGGDPLGTAGDFTTAPEISQMFGELIGAWLIDGWNRIGRPDPVRLVELGPGRGTLLADALRAGRIEPAWLSALRLDLVEINPALRAAQARRLGAYGPQWHESLTTVPEGPALLVANEFFDALPIRQLVFADGAWRERLVGWDADRGLHFTRANRPTPLAALVPGHLSRPAENSVFELSPAAIGIAHEIGRRIARFGGIALVIDYGDALHRLGETLQAVARHRKVGVFDDPCRTDLSALVDFEALGTAAAETGAAVFGPIGQGAFLESIGIGTRARALERGLDAPAAETIERAVRRLVAPEAMGTRFKALAIGPRGFVPAGFPAGT